jgi:hypothetical protein
MMTFTNTTFAGLRAAGNTLHALTFYSIGYLYSYPNASAAVWQLALTVIN